MALSRPVVGARRTITVVDRLPNERANDSVGGCSMGAGFEMLLSGTPLSVLLGLGLIAAIGFFLYQAL